jgi:UDP-N-acetyl-D-glucosamine dehydrogenase
VKETAALRRRILSRRATLTVLGQGHAGLSLSCAAADAGFHVAAIDVDEARIGDLQRGVLSVPGVSEPAFRAGLASGRITFSSSLEPIHEGDVVVVCVPVPIRDEVPDLHYMEEMCREVGQHLRSGHLVIMDSHGYPGMTDELVQPALESSGLSANHDFLLAYSPERLEPGNEEHGVQNTPRIVAGITREATGVAALFYGQFVDKVVQMSSCRAAELATFLENAFTHVNVGLVNEIAVLCREQGIDAWEVVEAAATKPFGFMPFDPGLGAGGNGVPLDVNARASEKPDVAKQVLHVLEQAVAENSRMPDYVAQRIEEALHDKGRDIRGARILALGVTSKPDVGDALESPALQVMNHLKRSGANITYHDPLIQEVMLNGDAVARTQLTERSVEAADCVAILTPHRAYDLDWIARHAMLVFDARNAYGPDRRPNVVRL